MFRSCLGPLLLLPLLSAADNSQPVNPCRAPTRPVDDTAQVTWNRFVDDVDVYRACINDFVQRNHAASDAHRQAANEATEAWNAFVKTSLNVPEDFPWPPESD